MICARRATTGHAVEPPAMQGAHQLVTVGACLNLAKHGEVGTAVRASTLNDVGTELDLGFNLGWGVEFSEHFGFGATYPLDRE